MARPLSPPPRRPREGWPGARLPGERLRAERERGPRSSGSCLYGLEGPHPPVRWQGRRATTNRRHASDGGSAVVGLVPRGGARGREPVRPASPPAHRTAGSPGPGDRSLLTLRAARHTRHDARGLGTGSPARAPGERARGRSLEDRCCHRNGPADDGRLRTRPGSRPGARGRPVAGAGDGADARSRPAAAVRSDIDGSASGRRRRSPGAAGPGASPRPVQPKAGTPGEGERPARRSAAQPWPGNRPVRAISIAIRSNEPDRDARLVSSVTGGAIPVAGRGPGRRAARNDRPAPSPEETEAGVGRPIHMKGEAVSPGSGQVRPITSARHGHRSGIPSASPVRSRAVEHESLPRPPRRARPIPSSRRGLPPGLVPTRSGPSSTPSVRPRRERSRGLGTVAGTSDPFRARRVRERSDGKSSDRACAVASSRRPRPG